MQPRGRGRAGLAKDAIQYAYRLLSYRDRSEKELRERLSRKEFSEGAIQSAINYLKEKGFVNDDALAASLKRSAEDVKLLGAQGVKLFLKRRGFSRETIGSVFSGGDSDETARAEKLVEIKMRSMKNQSEDAAKKKLWRFLARKGYSFDTIRKVLRKFKAEEES